MLLGASNDTGGIIFNRFVDFTQYAVIDKMI